jgi:hypothetical protein
VVVAVPKDFTAGYVAGLIIGLIIGVYIGLSMSRIVLSWRPTGIVFNRDQQGNITSIHYV